MSRLQEWAESGRISRDAATRLAAYARLVHQWNPKINLTGYKSIPEIESLLIEESVAALLALQMQQGSVLDFGSGAGVPGLIWAICNPELRVTSLEIRQKKIAFQKEVLRTLDLNSEVLCGHFPEAVQGRSFDMIVSRAIRLEPSAWNQTRALLKPSGRVVRFATPGTEEPGWTSLPATPHTLLLITC